MKVSLFDYELPEHLVAAVPADRRDASRLMVLRRREDELFHRRFRHLPEFLREGDLLVTNDARVLPARLQAERATGGAVEILLVRPEAPEQADEERWLAMLRASGSLRQGEGLRLEEADRKVTLLEERGRGYWLLSLGGPDALPRVLEAGHTPLPPYVQRARRERGMPEEMPELDRERYQTVYAEHGGAVAAPTAGLHFTGDLLQQLREAGVETRQLTLLVGPGTFRPVRGERVEEHALEAEFYHLPDETAEAVRDARREGRRVVAVGTTTCRVLEYVARADRWEGHQGWTDLYIHPPFQFRAVDALITNFHLPRSTLLMLVAALAGRERVLSAYREAVRRGYRFYSYGDAMLIL